LSDVLVIRRPCYSMHQVGMPTIGVDECTIGRIPHLHRRITASKGDVLAIMGRPRYCIFTISMPSMGGNLSSIRCIPDLHCPIATSRGAAPSVVRAGYAFLDTARVA